MATREQAKGNLIVKFGPFWARNEGNFRKLREEAEGLSGVYLLYCGWFPVYVGCGDLLRRIAGHGVHIERCGTGSHGSPSLKSIMAANWKRYFLGACRSISA